MVGSNCSMYGCSNSRNKTNGLGIFRIPTKDDEYNKNWHNALVQIITKDREVDDQLRDQQKGLYIFVKNTTEKIKSIVVSFSSLILIITIASNYKDFDLQKLSSTFLSYCTSQWSKFLIFSFYRYTVCFIISFNNNENL